MKLSLNSPLQRRRHWKKSEGQAPSVSMIIKYFFISSLVSWDFFLIPLTVTVWGFFPAFWAISERILTVTSALSSLQSLLDKKEVSFVLWLEWLKECSLSWSAFLSFPVSKLQLSRSLAGLLTQRLFLLIV